MNVSTKKQSSSQSQQSILTGVGEYLSYQDTNPRTPDQPSFQLPLAEQNIAQRSISTPLALSDESPNASENPFIEIAHPSISRKEKYIKTTKFFCKTLHNHIVNFVKENINRNFELVYNEDISTPEILTVIGKMDADIRGEPNIERAYQNSLIILSEKTEADLLQAAHSLELDEIENFRNAIFSCNVYKEISRKYYEFDDDRKTIAKLVLNSSTNSKTIKGFDDLVKNTIPRLIETINTKYYSIFRTIVGNKNIQKKTTFFLNYADKAILHGQQYEGYMKFINERSLCTISYLACYAGRMRIFIDLLERINESPKTLENLKIVLSHCKDCLKYYQVDKELYQLIQNAYPDDKVPFIEDYYQVRKYLESLVNAIDKLIAEDRAQSNEWIPTTMMKAIQSKPVIQKRKKGSKNTTTPPSPQPPLKAQETIDNPKQTPTPQTNPLKPESSPDINPTNPENTLPTKFEDNIIESEDNAIYESILQLFDQDRKEKLRLKRQKLGLNFIEENKISEEPTLSTNPIPFINIQVGDMELTFQKLEHSSFINPVWGVIISDNSIELQILSRYKKLLSNGTIGSGSISQLKGVSDCYEIGSSTMDSRLIGKKYNSGTHSALQKFMDLQYATLFAEELEKYGVDNYTSLIIFSAEAKKHQDINKVATKL